ncbi:MAG TPA: PadR family transcriptional regulator [Vicinamibacteria bacterium]|nr:PadR family transcriptional regulator [Vicinamibacteria bacterium]
MIGALEQMALLAVLRLREEASAVAIRKELHERTGKNVARGALYTVLERLEGKGYLVSWFGEPMRERGGRARRYYSVTVSGVKALRESKKAIQSLWSGLESMLGKSW